jgi:hypothetical protein
MRAASVIAIFALASLSAAAQEAITNRAALYQTALAHIAKVNGPSSSIIIEIRMSSGFEPRKQRVNVRGQISVAAATELVNLQLASNRRYLVDTREWEVEVIGDAEFASVRADNKCRDSCRYMVSGTYSFEQGKWLLLYEERLVS